MINNSENPDNGESHLEQVILVKTSLLICVAAIIWGVIYIAVGEVQAGFIPLSYTVLSILSLLLLRISKIFRFYQFTQILLILMLPFFLMMKLGGYINGSAVILWSLLAPIGALLSGKFRQARYWFFAFIGLVIISGILQPYLNVENYLSTEIITLFFIINIAAVSFITYLVLNYFVKNKDKVIELMEKNRELEISRLEQEVLLRKSDKLAMLGRLSAGIAHELNNPAAASFRGTKNLMQAIPELENNLIRLGEMAMSEDQQTVYNQFKQQIRQFADRSEPVNAVDISDREQELESWLDEHGFENAWDMAALFARLDFKTDDLNILTRHFTDEQLGTVLNTLYSVSLSGNLLEEIAQGTGRINEIIKSLKSYSYQEEVPVQTVNIHDGLNDTLVMLRSQLKKGIEVERDYEPDLPSIQARGPELSQVWTNIIDNAVTAMNGSGKITIKTFKQDPWIVVQISDTGHGIPAEVQSRIFDPFFTTKLPGEGTGLGLNISHDIIVNRHHGKLNVVSKPGETCFEIRLPLDNAADPQ